MREKLSQSTSAKKTNKSGFPRIKFVALASKYLISRLTQEIMLVSRLAKRED